MITLVERLRQTLAGRYDVEQELGRGGMAVVYLARDLRLERRVAIKVFEYLSADPAAAERFLREVQIAAKLQHPNILPVFESGEGEGLLYYVMPYVVGATLRERLEREGPLPITEAVQIARDVALALDGAHREGIIHRDIKPENVMLASGVAVVADFGIARAVESGKLTETGLAIGTPVYMSPEQATAAPLIDGRADIYSLGCVLYEMLAGSPPFAGPTAQAVMARHTADQVPPLSTVRRVPTELEALVAKALAKLPADRWQTGRALAEALERTGAGAAAPMRSRLRGARLATAALGVLMLAAGWFAWSRRAAPTPASIGPHLVAVLPFATRGDSVHASDLADGLTEGVSNGLVRVEGLGVLPPSRTRSYADRATDPQAVGHALGVQAVVSARVEVAGNSFRVWAQLTDVASGRSVWGQTFDGELLAKGRIADVFSIQDSISGAIVTALVPTLAPERRALAASGPPTSDLEAYGLYQQARREDAKATMESERRAVLLLRRALDRDSTFADAWRLYSVALIGTGETGRPNPQAKLALDRAIQLDSVNGEALLARSFFEASEWDWEAAARDLERALRVSPGVPSVLKAYAFDLLSRGKADSALYYLRRRLALDPAGEQSWADMALGFYVAGMPDSALATARRSESLDPTNLDPTYTLMHVNLDLGRRAAADSAAAKYLRIAGWDDAYIASAAAYYRRSGNLTRAREMLDSLESLDRRRHVPRTFMAMGRLAVGDRAGALDLLEQAARNHEMYLGFGIVPNKLDEINFGPILTDPRYQEVRRRVFSTGPSYASQAR